MNTRFKIFRLQKVESSSVSPHLYGETFTLAEVYFDGDGLPTQEEAEKQVKLSGYTATDYVILPVLQNVRE